MFQGLDWLLAEARARGLRLLLNLTNYWNDYGGMLQYVAWACKQRGQQVRRQGLEAMQAMLSWQGGIGSAVVMLHVPPLLSHPHPPRA